MDEIQDKERLQTEYVRSALHYYITARFATINALVPLAGNLAHHAVELFLKAALLKNTTKGAEGQIATRSAEHLGAVQGVDEQGGVEQV